MAVIEVINESGLDLDLDDIEQQVQFLLDQLRLHEDTEVSLLFVDVDRMTELHIQWMDEPGPTDVMSFPMDDLVLPTADAPAEPGILGDIVMCPQFAATQAAEAGQGMNEELELLLTHGVLHLLGMDHQEDDARLAMFAIQDELLAAWRRSRT